MEKNKEIVRITRAELRQCKNIARGVLPISSGYQEKADILGIFGQNGTGKSAVTEAFSYLRCLLRGETLPPSAGAFIRLGSPESSCAFRFEIIGETRLPLEYVFTLVRRENGAALSREELILLPDPSAGRKRRRSLLSFPGGRILPSKIRRAVSAVMVSGSSGLFGADIREWTKQSLPSEDVLRRATEVLRAYGRNGLYVTYSASRAPAGMDLPLPGGETFRIPFSSWCVAEEPRMAEIRTALPPFSGLLAAVIPGLEVILRESGGGHTPEGRPGVRFTLMTRRDGKTIPLGQESEGIRKLLSLMSLLLRVYEDPSVCLVADELDASLFEYLLGELLRVLEQDGLGQLVFTSHDLRPLEMIDRRKLLFTTANPENRFIRLRGRGGNLRDQYLRSIALGGEAEAILPPTDPYAVSRAFRQAGRSLRGKD